MLFRIQLVGYIAEGERCRKPFRLARAPIPAVETMESLFQGLARVAGAATIF